MDFDRWFNQQGRGETEEVDDTIYLHCCHCGKAEYVSLSQVMNGDIGWYTDTSFDEGEGLCGGGEGCTP